MLLQGSCHCQRVRFRVRCPHPYPFLLCYCSICRKTEGGGGYGINLGGDNASLEVEGRGHVSVYCPLIEDPRTGERREDPGERHFCRHCGRHGQIDHVLGSEPPVPPFGGLPCHHGVAHRPGLAAATQLQGVHPRLDTLQKLLELIGQIEARRSTAPC
ncbi:MAG: hypothetical protein P8Y25_04835 [Chromatiaceae bacterium]